MSRGSGERGCSDQAGSVVEDAPVQTHHALAGEPEGGRGVTGVGLLGRRSLRLTAERHMAEAADQYGKVAAAGRSKQVPADVWDYEHSQDGRDDIADRPPKMYLPAHAA